MLSVIHNKLKDEMMRDIYIFPQTDLNEFMDMDIHIFVAEGRRRILLFCLCLSALSLRFICNFIKKKDWHWILFFLLALKELCIMSLWAIDIIHLVNN